VVGWSSAWLGGADAKGAGEGAGEGFDEKNRSTGTAVGLGCSSAAGAEDEGADGDSAASSTVDKLAVWAGAGFVAGTETIQCLFSRASLIFDVGGCADPPEKETARARPEEEGWGADC
jgi:hypothetical protein